MRIYIGWDDREEVAFDVAAKTATAFGAEVISLNEGRLRMAGLLDRPIDRRGGVRWDFTSDAAQSTDFANSRFLVPILAHDGWCLFTDCDVVFLRDPHTLLNIADASKAVMVVKHPPLDSRGVKMDNQPQQPYFRKNWSSVMLVNASHPANRRLNLSVINSWPGRDLHAFGWLSEEEIGELPPEWNWLVNLQPKPADPAIAHFTLGVPALEGVKKSEHDWIWWRACE